jgi:hypothetical protein
LTIKGAAFSGSTPTRKVGSAQERRREKPDQPTFHSSVFVFIRG